MASCGPPCDSTALVQLGRLLPLLFNFAWLPSTSSGIVIQIFRIFRPSVYYFLLIMQPLTSISDVVVLSFFGLQITDLLIHVWTVSFIKLFYFHTFFITVVIPCLSTHQLHLIFQLFISQCPSIDPSSSQHLLSSIFSSKFSVVVHCIFDIILPLSTTAFALSSVPFLAHSMS